MDDNEIIDLFMKRDADAIKVLDEKFHSYCYSIAYSILNNHEDSEECINDALYKVWNLIPPAKPKYLKLYLSKIVRNIAIDRYRSDIASKRGNGSIDEVLDELNNCITPAINAVEDTIIENELIKAVNDFVSKLPKKQANIFIRRYFFCESHKAIAERYGLSESDVFTSLSRTRKKLKKLLNKEGYLC